MNAFDSPTWEQTFQMLIPNVSEHRFYWSCKFKAGAQEGHHQCSQKCSSLM